MLQRCIINIIETGRKYPLPGLVYMFCLQRFSCNFESTVVVFKIIIALDFEKNKCISLC